MSVKSERLVQKLAGLFVEYPLKDWQPILEALSKSDEYRPLAAAVTKQLIAVSGQKRVARTVAKKRPVARVGDSRKTASMPSDELRELELALLSRKMLHSASELRIAADLVGLKVDLPSDRNDAIRKMISHLKSLSKASRAAALARITDRSEKAIPDRGSEFERWASLILETKRES